MAPIKFEENIKDKLEKRNIEPSANIWGKLSDKLDEHEGGSNNKMIWWLGIAASLVGVFLIATIFFKTTEDQTTLPITVETPLEKSSEVKGELTDEIDKSKVEGIAETEIKSESPLINEIKNKEPKELTNFNNKKSNSGRLAKNTAKEPQIGTNQSILSDSVIHEQTINQPILANTQIKKVRNTVTESEIEALLENAKSELLANKSEIVLSKTVDANSLLQDVETDLDETFRDKVFNTLVSGYNSVRTAVASRND